MLGEVHGDHQRLSTSWFRHLDACNHFYGGMSPSMKQLLETMCGGDLLNENPDEAMDFLNMWLKLPRDGMSEPQGRWRK